MSTAVKLHDVSKSYPRAGAVRRKLIQASGRHLSLAADFNGSGQVQTVLQRVSFEVGEGEILGVLGAHGSGKTTLIRMLAGLIQPDEGEIRIFGINPLRQPAQVQRWVNRTSVEASFFKQLSPLENLLQGGRLSVPAARREAPRRRSCSPVWAWIKRASTAPSKRWAEACSRR